MRRFLGLATISVLAAAALTSVATPPTSAAAAGAATVSVDDTQSLAQLPAVGSGMNVAVWDSRMNDPATTQLLRDAGVKAVRYPGGGYSDGYHWQTHTVEDGGYVAPNTE